MINWIISWLGGGILDKIIDIFAKSDDIRIRGKEIDADVAKELMRTYVEGQRIESTKWAFPWFPLMAAPFILSIAVFFITLTAYNILWHPNGIYPQTWNIAAYPGIYQDWASTAFNWIFAPALGVVTLKALLK